MRDCCWYWEVANLHPRVCLLYELLQVCPRTRENMLTGRVVPHPVTALRLGHISVTAKKVSVESLSLVECCWLDWVPVPASLCISCQTNLQLEAGGVMTDDWYTKRELEQRPPPTPTTGSGLVRRGQRKNTANLFISSRPWYVDVKRQAGHGAAVVSPLIEFKASFVFFTVEEF